MNWIKLTKESKPEHGIEVLLKTGIIIDYEYHICKLRYDRETGEDEWQGHEVFFYFNYFTDYCLITPPID